MAEFYNTGFHGKSLFSSIKSGTKYVERFLSGFAGYGWKLWEYTAGKWKLEVDAITVRGPMTIFEFLVSKIRSIKGALGITQGFGTIAAVELITPDSGDPYYSITLDDKDLSFVANDFFRCQTFSGTSQKMYHVEIASISGSSINVLQSEFTDSIPEVGDDIVQFGNSVNTARQSAIYLHADEDGQPAIDVMFGINSKNWDGCVKIRIGGDIPGTDGLKGFYCVNGLIKGVNDTGTVMYQINPDGSASFAQDAVNFKADKSGFIAGGAISWAYNATTAKYECTLASNVLLTWNNLSTETQTNLKGEKGDSGAVGATGATGIAGHTFKWMFYASDSYEQSPEFGQGLVTNPNDDPGANNKWNYTPSTSTTFIYIWMIQAEFDGSGVIVKKADNTYWTAPVCITGSDGQNGTDGTDVEFIYKSSTSATAPTTPTSVNTDGNIPTGWTDHPTGVTSASMYEYVCVRYNKTGNWGIYSTAVLWAKWGEKGQDGDGFEYVYKGTSTNTSPSTPVATGTSDDEVPTGWTDNPTGVTSILPYEWVSVRKKTNGTWGTFSAPAVWAKYGADGTNGTNGTNGAAGVDGSDGTDGTSIVWKGDFSTHPSSPSNGWAYRNTTDKKSYTYRDGTWYQMTIDGANGTNGADGLSIVWKGDLSSAPASPVKNWVYRDTDNGLVYIYTGTAWALMVADGSDGADGTNGTDGLSVFITYNAIATEPAVPTGNGTLNGWHTSATSSDVWMSQKVAASSTSGTWGNPIKIKGDTGASGADGKDANLLPWLVEWDTNATLIDGTKVVSPKAFFGTKNETTGKLTGFGMGTGVIETGKSDIIGVNEGEVMTRLSAETGKLEAKDANISGTVNATNGTFSGLLRNTTHTRLFSVNEAVTSGFYYLTGDDDFNLTVGSSYSEGSTLCLPTEKKYDGVKCTIVNSGVYDANEDFQGYNIKVMVKNSEVEGQKSFYANSLAAGNQILEIRLLRVSVLHLWAFWRKDLALTDGGELIWIIENPNDFNAALYDATNYYLTSKSGQWE